MSYKPEQLRALEVLQESMHQWDKLYFPVLPDKMFPTGFKAFFNPSQTSLPHGESWVWNQSNAKMQIEWDDCSVLMQKMNTRRKKNAPKAPFYKIWLFTVTSANNKQEKSFLWCEKGTEPKDNSLSQEFQPPEHSKPEKEQKPVSVIQNPAPVVAQNQVVTPKQQPKVSMPQYYSVALPCSISRPNNYDFVDAMEIDEVDSLLWPTYSYTDDLSFLHLDAYVAERLY
jgi:hypothetical protein